MILGSPGTLKTIRLTDLVSAVSVDGTRIHFSKSIKSLDVLLTPSLDWSDQITLICNKISLTLYELLLNRHLLTRDLRIEFVCTLIFTHLDYCCLLMFDLSRKDDHRSQRALNSAIRFIFDAD